MQMTHWKVLSRMDLSSLGVGSITLSFSFTSTRSTISTVSSFSSSEDPNKSVSSGMGSSLFRRLDEILGRADVVAPRGRLAAGPSDSTTVGAAARFRNAGMASSGLEGGISTSSLSVLSRLEEGLVLSDEAAGPLVSGSEATTGAGCGGSRGKLLSGSAPERYAKGLAGGSEGELKSGSRRAGK